jgi:beta-glucosidase-like glycosyl hydrolase
LSHQNAKLLVGQIFARRLARDLSSLDLERFPVANYIVFKDALGESWEVSKTMLAEARQRLNQIGIEPVMMMDEEGGRVTQLSGFFPSAPSSRAVAGSLQPADAGRLYARLSESLAALGIDINLAPCVDVNTEPLNPIIGTRSFGNTREAVEQYTQAFITASRDFVGCVAKHFPGHGMTSVDSHLDMPAVDLSGMDLAATHIPPFQTALRAGAVGIMVGHCCYTAIQEESLPASLSKNVVHALLREELGFEGIVITDSMDMEAVTARTDPPAAARAAFRAGADILLYTDYSRRFEEAFEAILSDVQSGRIDRERLAQSIARRHTFLNRHRGQSPPADQVSQQRYLELRKRVLAGSLRVDDPGHRLPLPADPPVYVTTDPIHLENTALHTSGAKSIVRADQAKDRVLILWLLEPFRIAPSVETMREMIATSRLSVLVTSYRSMADMLGACDVSVITDDTSPETTATILERLLGRTP